MATPFSTFTGTNKSLLTDALLSPSSGIAVNTGSITLKASAQTAVNFYDGSLGALGIGSGLLLTSGTTPGTTNTVGWFGTDNSGSSGFYNGDADINAVVNTVFQTQSYDATSLAFDFTVTDPTATSISFDIVFGSDEYPEWVDAFVDSAIVMVNGVNYALFNHDPSHPLSVVSSNLAAGYFQNNANNALPIEYDGVSHVLKIVAPINADGSTNHIKIAIADTGDHIYDSGMFIANLAAGNTPGSGVVSVTPPGSTTDNNDVITGSAQDEYIDLKGGDDIAYGGAGDDIIVAGAGNDTVYGGSGNDQMKGDGGDDYLEGGDGLDDTAVFSGASTEYSLVYNATTASYTITDSKTGSASEGTDTLKNVEFAKFSNGLFAITPSGFSSGSTPPPIPTNSPGLVIISGVTAVGNVLTATVSDPDGIFGGVVYQWQVSSNNGATWSNVGSDSKTYTVAVADIGAQVQVIASYTDGAALSESVVSAPKSILETKNGDLVVTLMQLQAPLGSSTINPLTTLVQNAIDLGLSPNTAAIAIKTVLGLPSNINLQSYDAYGILQSSPTNAQALKVEKVAVQVAILTSLSDDDTGLNLTAKILNAAANNQTLDLANANHLANILDLNITGLTKANYPQPLREIFDRNKSMSDAIADGDGIGAIETEWQDLLSIQDGINSTSIADLSIHLNQPPIGTATANLAPGTEGSPYQINAADLLIGFSDPDADPLSVTNLGANIAGTFTNNPSNIWIFTPDVNYNGPVELTYTVIDGQGGAIDASQLFVLESTSTPSLPTFTGTAAANKLTGTTGADMLIGLGGNDTYTVNHTGDIVVEAFNQGTDIVNTTLSYTLTDNVEKLTLLGTNNIDGTGNALNNTLTGNTGNNILIGLGGNDIIDGKAGADTLQGGLGNDTYTIDNVGDLVTEAFNEGIDTVKTTISYTLTDNVEKLTLLGTNNIDGTGNALNNTLTGNVGNNTLIGWGGNDSINGNAGNDILVGGTGKDTLTGGIGNDKFSYQSFGDSLLSGYDVIKDFNAIDDVFLVSNTPSLFTANAGNVTGLTASKIQGILTSDILAHVGDVAKFTYGSRTFISINDATAGFQANTDTLIELTTSGLVGTLGLNNFLLA